MTAVTCPIMRYHPAVIAQGAATMAVLTENRFILGLGAGERLNEHVVGEGWPGIGERHERLSEAYDIIRGLLDGSIENYRGKYFMLDNAKLYDRPAAGGPEAARLTGRKADGIITTVPEADLIEDFRSAGGKGPLYAEVPMCYAASEDKAREVAHRYHRWSLAGGLVMPELPDTGTFAAASSHITPDQVAEEVSLGPSPEAHLEAIREYIDAGFDHLILTQIGPEQDLFFEFFERELRHTLLS